MILLSVGICFDTLAISISIGLNDRKVYFWQAFKIATIFAFFQGIMPFFGWLGGKALEKYMTAIGYWIAFGLLLLVGGKMILEAFSKKSEKEIDIANIRLILTLALVTSIDAFAVGVTLGIAEVNIWIVYVIIGFITGLTAMIGILIGKKLASLFGSKFEIFGGLILIALGTKILLEHLNYI